MLPPSGLEKLMPWYTHFLKYLQNPNKATVVFSKEEERRTTYCFINVCKERESWLMSGWNGQGYSAHNKITDQQLKNKMAVLRYADDVVLWVLLCREHFSSIYYTLLWTGFTWI